MNQLCSLWIGGQIGPLEELVLESWLKLGYKFTLFSDRELNLPSSVECRPHQEICDIFDHGDFSPKHPFNFSANGFRYMLLKKNPSFTWVDMDAIGWMRLPDDDFLVGRQDNKHANNGLLRIPVRYHFILDTLLKRYNDPWLAWRELRWLPRIRALLELMKGISLIESISSQKIAGPIALTAELKKHPELWAMTRPILDFYPIAWDSTDLFFEKECPGLFSNTYSIHLWATTRQRFMKDGWIPGSNLDYIRRKIQHRC
jgi:hypothetical protein